MHTARSASDTQSPSRSAVEYTATASAPASWQARTSRTAASPLFAMSTRLSTTRSGGLELEQRLAVLDRVAVLGEHSPDDPRLLRLQLVEELHRLEQRERLADLDPVALLHERRLVRRGAAIERADHRRVHLDGRAHLR